jgi:hypothetical protein
MKVIDNKVVVPVASTVDHSGHMYAIDPVTSYTVRFRKVRTVGG